MIRVNLILDDFQSEWTLDAVPRIGDRVQFDGFRTGTVKDVLWCFVDSDGKPTKHRYVNVWLGAPA